MKKYTYLTFKTIVPSLLFIAIVTFVCLYFFGGLKASNIIYDNIPWNLDDFVDIALKEKDYQNYKYQKDMGTLPDGAEVVDPLNKMAFVADSEKYVMFIDEETTIVSVYEKPSDWDPSNPVLSNSAKPIYATAIDGGSVAQKSNLSITYYNSKGMGTTINSFDKSVQFENAAAGSVERYYQIRNREEDNYVDILYTIGNFNSFTFPKVINYKTFAEQFVGNTFLNFSESDSLATVNVFDANGKLATVLNSDGNETGKVVPLRYTSVSTISKDVVLYLFEKGLIKSVTASGVTYPGEKETIEDAINKIKEAPDQIWVLGDGLIKNGVFQLKIGADYNCENSPIIINPFLPRYKIQQIITSFYKFEGQVQGNSAKDALDFTRIYEILTDNYIDMTMTNYGSFTFPVKKTLFKQLYIGSFNERQDGIKIYDPNYLFKTVGNDYLGLPYFYDYNQDGIFTIDEHYQLGGYHLRDEDGNFMYDEDENGNFIPIQAGFTVEDAQFHNDYYNNIDETTTVVFQICMRVELNENGFGVSIIHDSIIEGVGSDNKDSSISSMFKHDRRIGEIAVCKFLATNTSLTDAGQIILPDGSGSVISFNNPKASQNINQYPEKRIYGIDYAITRLTMSSFTYDLMFPMFGFLETTQNKGVVCIVDKGAAQTSISANIYNNTNKYNNANFKSYLREKEIAQITSSTSYIRMTRELFQGDIAYKYIILTDDISYNGVAAAYREYLIDKYYLEEKDETKVAHPTISFTGAYEKKTLKLAFVTNSAFSLTTFEQARNIVSDLVDNGVKSMDVAYFGWTDEEYDTKITDNPIANKVLGGKKGLKELNEYLTDLGFRFYPYVNITQGRGYSQLFGSLKYSSKSIVGSYSNALDYIVSSGLEDSSRGRYTIISPIYYNALMNNFLDNYQKYNITGFTTDLGMNRSGDYSKNIQLYTEGGVRMQEEALRNAYDSGLNIHIEAPYDFTFPYLSTASYVPIETTMYNVVDYAIPLYQLVCSGLFDYSLPDVNNNSSQISHHWSFLKALETGSNLGYYLTAIDTSSLINTNYSHLYDTYYYYNRNDIIKYNNLLNESGIYEGRLYSHQYVTDSVVKVIYQMEEKFITVFINYGLTDYRTEGLTILSNSYIVREGIS